MAHTGPAAKHIFVLYITIVPGQLSLLGGVCIRTNTSDAVHGLSLQGPMQKRRLLLLHMPLLDLPSALSFQWREHWRVCMQKAGASNKEHAMAWRRAIGAAGLLFTGVCTTNSPGIELGWLID